MALTGQLWNKSIAMSSGFSWNKVLGEADAPVNPAVAEGLAIDPVTGQPLPLRPSVSENPFLSEPVPAVPQPVASDHLTPSVVTSHSVSQYVPEPVPLVSIGANALAIEPMAVRLEVVEAHQPPQPQQLEPPISISQATSNAPANPFLVASNPSGSAQSAPVGKPEVIPYEGGSQPSAPVLIPATLSASEPVVDVMVLNPPVATIAPQIVEPPVVTAVVAPAPAPPVLVAPPMAAPPVQAAAIAVTRPIEVGAPKSQYQPAPVPRDVFAKPKEEPKYASTEPAARVLQGDASVRSLADIHIDDILRVAIDRKASDIHLTVGLPPMMRMDGDIVPLPFETLTAQDTRRLVYDVLSNEHVQKFETKHELDFAHAVKGLARFRFNVYLQRGSVAGALRAIPTKIPSFDTLGLPPIVREVSKRTSGLILVTGPTGSGKSTTIASMVDDINETRQNHILTIEDPIEYLHTHKKCMVNQRELHADTFSFHDALRAVLREDPDIILVGELRDLETIEAALTLAETGHLVFGTLHTRNAPSTIDRIIDVFSSDQQDQIRVLLGNTLEGVVSQQLLPKLGGGRCAAIEVMLGTPAIKNLIREGKTHQMYSSIETSSQIGMQTMDRSLSEHFRNGRCSYEECLMRAVDKETFSRLAKGG